MGVRGFAPSMEVRPAPTRATLALHPKSLRQIGKLGFFGTNSGSVYEPLLWEVRFFIGNREGIEVLAKPIFVRGVSPFYGWHASCLAGAPCARLEKVAVGFGFTSVCGPGRKLRRAPFPLPSRGRGRALLSPLRSARRGRFSAGFCRLLPPRLFCRCTPLCC